MSRLPLLLLILSLFGCASRYPARAPLGEAFPSVRGESLAGAAYRIPEDFAGAPVLLLVGYEQDAQFDIDRWLLGLWQARVDVRAYELPTVRGMAPRMLSAYIDNGMRSGIPSEDWGSVITIYSDAADLARFTGDEERLTARVVLLDADGHVAFFHDSGFSVGALTRLEDALASLGRNPS
jgi:hypothetical protein